MLEFTSAIILIALYLARRNIFSLVFFVLLVIFLYSRFLVSFIYDDFVVGGEEWIFPGVGLNAINLYKIYFLAFLFAFLFSTFFLKPVKIISGWSFDAPKILKLLTIIGIFAGAYRGYLYTTLLISSGYLATVDFIPPVILSLITGSLLKPLGLLFLVLYVRTENKNWRSLFFLYCLILMFSWQRGDVITLLIIFWCLSVANHKNYLSGTRLRIYLGPILIFALGFLIFFVREDASTQIDGRIILDLLWASGISINPGLYVAELSDKFTHSDVWGFPLTYISCGVGRLFSDLCYSDARLSVPGFFLEKITNSIGIESYGSFVGLGGNLIASILVASNITGQFLIDLFLFFFVGLCILYSVCFFI